MKKIVFWLLPMTGLITGMFFGCLDITVRNADTAPLDAEVINLLPKWNDEFLLTYSAIGFFSGLILYLLLKLIFKKYRKNF